MPLPLLKHSMALCYVYLFSFFLFLKILLGLDRREGREKERGRNIDVQEIHKSVASHTPPTEDLACNPGIALTGN